MLEKLDNPLGVSSVGILILDSFKVFLERKHHMANRFKDVVDRNLVLSD